MRPGLLAPSADDDLRLEAPSGADDAPPVVDPTLVADLGLDRLLRVMAAGDTYLDEVGRRVLGAPLHGVEAIRHRQASVADAIASPTVVRALYDVTVDAIETERRIWGAQMRNAEFVLDRSANVLGGFTETLRALRRIATTEGTACTSPGFTSLFGLLESRFDDAWLDEVDGHIRRLRSRTIHVSARLGSGQRGTGYTLHRDGSAVGWRDRLSLEERRSTIEVTLSNQNEMNMLSELRSVAVAPTAGVLVAAADELLRFFRRLRAELGFLLAAVNLHDALVAAGGRVCFPDPVVADGPAFAATGLYDPGLRLAIDGPVATNDVEADGRHLVVVTGSNGGGKTTFLRAVGLAQLMLQAGLFVAADRVAADLRADLHTHFTREEDAAMADGRLHEELGRLAGIVDACSPASLVLLNESFSTTDERQGAAIGTDAVLGLVDAGTRVWLVTHNHELASGLEATAGPTTLFLRAARGEDGERPFRIETGPPLRTSHGMDLYARIIGPTPTPTLTPTPTPDDTAEDRLT
jgi:hypothetical protein